MWRCHRALVPSRMVSESSQIRPFREGVELNLGLLIKGRNKIVELGGDRAWGSDGNVMWRVLETCMTNIR